MTHRIDKTAKVYFSDLSKYAEMINLVCFQAKPVVTKDMLHQVDTANIFRANKQLRQQYRDMIQSMLFTRVHDIGYIFFGTEVESGGNEELPLKICEYDIAFYRYQADEIRKKLREKVGYARSMPRDTKLNPVYTIVLYLSDEPYLGPMSLHEMIYQDIPNLQNHIPQYHLFLIDPRTLDDARITMLKTDLKAVLTLLKYRDNPSQIYQILSKDSTYQKLEPDTFEFLTACVNLKLQNNDSEKGDGNMTNGFHILLEQSKNEGISQGIVQGLEEGRSLGSQDEKFKLASKLLARHFDISEICELTELSLQQVQDFIQKEKEN